MSETAVRAKTSEHNARTRIIAGLVGMTLPALLTACTGDQPESGPRPVPTVTVTVTSSPSASSSPEATATPTSASPRPSVSAPPKKKYFEPNPDLRWQFQTNHSEWNDKWHLRQRWLTSPWYEGAHQVMIGFGCNDSQYYEPNPACPDKTGKHEHQGTHHGLDVAMDCGQKIFYGDNSGVVADKGRPGAPGSAYGNLVFRIIDQNPSVGQGPKDLLFGHVEKVFVKPGETVKRGQLIALVGDRGVETEDGCHLHFEQREPKRGVASASDPTAELQFSAVG